MNRVCTSILLLVLTPHGAHAMKTISRLRIDQSKSLSWRILMPDNDFVGTSGAKLNAIGKIANDVIAACFTTPLAKFNITTSYVKMDSFSTGYPDKYGNYSGSIGRLQRHEADVAFMWTRLDAIVGNPITTGPAYAPGDMVIGSSKMEHRNLTIDILHVFENADDITYSAFASCAYVSATLLGFFVIYERRQSIFSATTFPMQMMNSLWNIFSLVVDQEHFRAISLKTRLLWAHFVIASFFAVFGYFLNSMSTDQVAHRPVRQIESIDDIISGRFPKSPPHIIKNNFLYPLLLSARNGSKLNQLLRILQKRGPDAIADLKFGGSDLSERMLRMKQQMRDNAGCLLIPQLYHEHILKRFVCHDDIDLGSRARVGREMFGGGVIVWMLRNGIDDGLRRLATLKLGSLREFGIVDKMTPMMVQALLDSLGRETKWENLQCMAGFEEKEKQVPHLKQDSFGKIQILSFGGILSSLVVLLAEVIAGCLRSGGRLSTRKVRVDKPLLATATQMRWIHSLKI